MFRAQDLVVGRTAITKQLSASTKVLATGNQAKTLLAACSGRNAVHTLTNTPRCTQPGATSFKKLSTSTLRGIATQPLIQKATRLDTGERAFSSIQADQGFSKTELTNYPSFTVQMYLQINYMYKKPKDYIGSSSEFMSDKLLKESLSRLVNEYYKPLAGRIKTSGDAIYLEWPNSPTHPYRDSESAPFVFETETVESEYAEFKKKVKGLDKSLWCAAQPRVLGVPKETDPLLLIKVTRLGAESDALVINLSVHHMLMDGFSLAQFMQNWAVVYRQLEGAQGDVNISIPHKPDFDIPNIDRFRKEPRQTHGNDETNGNLVTSFAKPNEISDHFLSLSASQQHEIREKAHKEGLSFTTLLYAILWKELTKLYLKYRPDMQSKMGEFSLTLNSRPYLGASPNLCITSTAAMHASIKTSEIPDMDPVDIAKEIKKTVGKISPQSICDLVDDCAEVWPEVRKMTGEDSECGLYPHLFVHSDQSAPCIFASTNMNFPHYNIDFGYGGPVQLRMQRHFVQGLLMVYPPNPTTPDNSMQIDVYLPKEFDISKSEVLSKYLSIED